MSVVEMEEEMLFLFLVVLAYRHIFRLREFMKYAGWCERGQRRDVPSSERLGPGVTPTWRKGEIHTGIFSADWMMHHSPELPW